MNWIKVLALIPVVEAEVKAFQAAVTIEDKAKAIGELAKTGLAIVEALTGKDIANDAKLADLVADVLKVIADAQALKP